ncbi:MAG TPA: DUF87 domain-containing protein [Patescibacteria group bacterium]|nr:DUF87 domain-containing protein [Patescibacteria group bacterium]
MPFLGDLRSGQKSGTEKTYREGLASVLDLIAPGDFIVTPNYLQINQYYVKTLFVYTYPRYLYTNWLSPVITYDVTMDLGMFVYPVESRKALEDLKNRIGQMESAYRMEKEKGLVSDPELETAMQDVESLRFALQKGEVKLFKFSLYFTIFAKTPEELETVTQQLESHLGGKLIYTKPAFLQMEEGFHSTLALGLDNIMITQNLDTGSVSSTFPFTSTELTSNDGILYGINRHNNSLILFDRFALENANMVVFGKSGGGKSYAIKLEALRSLMWGTDVIVIDPEDEYRKLAESVGGTYLEISVKSKQRINPFDLPKISENETGEDVLREAVVSAHGLINLMVGGLTPAEDALLDRALFETYAIKDITVDPVSHKNPPPLLTDLHNVLKNMRGAENIVYKLSKYTEGSFAGLFNQPTNVNLGSGFIDFSIKNLEDQLRPVGMYLILNFIWQKVKSEMRRRILIVDEAWWMMQYEDSAQFLSGLCRRARKYYLGVSVISQDVEDFLANKYGKVIVSNSALQLLLKQSPASIDKICEVFNLTEGEKFLILEADVGEGLFFAGLNHVAIKVIGSYTEDQIITSDPKQILAMRGKAA